MLQELPRSQAEVFDRAGSYGGQAPSAQVSRHQRYQMQLALASDTEDPVTMAAALTSLLQQLYQDCLARVPVINVSNWLYVIKVNKSDLHLCSKCRPLTGQMMLFKVVRGNFGECLLGASCAAL